MSNVHCGYELNLGPVPFPAALDTVVNALEAEGLSVSNRTDVRKLFQRQLGVEFPPYTILEVWNAKAAYEGMTTDPKLGLLLPGHVTVRSTTDGVMVGIVNARALLRLLGERSLEPLVDAIHPRLCRMLAGVR